MSKMEAAVETPPRFEMNALFAAMSQAERERLERNFEFVDLPLDLVLADSHQPIEYA